MKQYQWLNSVSNNVAKQAVKDACEAYKNYFKKLADKPRFKSRRKSKPSVETLMIVERINSRAEALAGLATPRYDPCGNYDFLI